MASNFGKAYKEKKKEDGNDNLQSELSSYSKMDKMISRNIEQKKPEQEEPEQKKPKKKTPEQKKTEQKKPEQKKTIKKVSHKVFSFWALREDIAKWQAYYKTIGKFKSVEEFGKAAMDAYMEKYPIPEENKVVYEFFLNQEKQGMKLEQEQAEQKYTKK